MFFRAICLREARPLARERGVVHGVLAPLSGVRDGAETEAMSPESTIWTARALEEQKQIPRPTL